MGALVRGRLLNLARSTGQPFDLLLTRYALERLLYRLVQTPHGDRFVLKGAVLMTTWFEDPYRPTRDLDLLGLGDPEPDAMLQIFRDAFAVVVEDGVAFDADALRITTNREDLAYGGLRLETHATIGGARQRILIDIGFGDAIEPGLQPLVLPVLLGQPAPVMRAYARETVIAEKFQAMVKFGQANTRLKDYYDIWVLARSYEFDVQRLARAIAATFSRRQTAIPTELPDGLKSDFHDDDAKKHQWAAFIEDVAIDPGPLESVARDIAAFLLPAAVAARKLHDQEIGRLDRA